MKVKSPNQLLFLKFSLLGSIILLVAIPFFWIYQLYNLKDYTDFIVYVSQLFNESFLVNDLEKNFTLQNHFNYIQKLKPLLLIALIIVTGISLGIIKFTLSVLPNKEDELKVRYSKRNQLIIFSLICFWLGYKVFLFYFIPAHMDEMFDYVFYTKSNLITRHTYIFTDGKQWYNNHLLYSDLSSIFYTLGFPQKLAMRLPSMLGEFLLLVFLWFRFKEEKIQKVLFILLVLGSSFWASIYSVEGRSYYLVGVCTIVSFFLTLDLLQKPNKHQFLAFVLVSIIGFGLNKLYAIPFLGLIIFIGLTIKNKEDFVFWFRTLLLVALLTLLFYYPALIVSGKRAVYTNIDTPNDLGLRLYPVLMEGFSVMTNMDQKSYLGLLALTSLIVAFRKKISFLSRRLSIFFMAQIASLATFTILLGSYMPERAFIYLNLCFYLLLAVFVWDLLKKQKTWLLMVVILLIANTIFNFNYSWLTENQRFVLGRKYYAQVKEAAFQMNRMDIDTIHVDPSDFQSLIFTKYYLKNAKISTSELSNIEKGDKLISNQELDSSLYLKKELIPDFDMFIYTKN